MNSRQVMKKNAKDIFKANKGAFIGAGAIFIALLVLHIILTTVLGIIPLLGDILTGVETFCYILLAMLISVQICSCAIKATRGQRVTIRDILAFNLGKLWKVIKLSILLYLYYLVALIPLGIITGISFMGVVKQLQNGIVSGSATLLLCALLWFVYMIFVAIYFIKYSLASYIIIDDNNGNIGARKSLKLSKQVMHGHVLELIVLALSFIGWLFLFSLIAGIGAGITSIPLVGWIVGIPISLIGYGVLFFYVTPYMLLTMVQFYFSVTNQFDPSLYYTQPLGNNGFQQSPNQYNNYQQPYNNRAEFNGQNQYQNQNQNQNNNNQFYR